jgi:hypothetical protein
MRRVLKKARMMGLIDGRRRVQNSIVPASAVQFTFFSLVDPIVRLGDHQEQWPSPLAQVRQTDLWQRTQAHLSQKGIVLLLGRCNGFLNLNQFAMHHFQVTR